MNAFRGALGLYRTTRRVYKITDDCFITAIAWREGKGFKFLTLFFFNLTKSVVGMTRVRSNRRFKKFITGARLGFYLV